MTNTFATSAMLVSLTVKGWGGQVEDKRISAEVAQQHNTSADAGKYKKVLVDKKRLEPITKAATALRAFHYENTLPWLDEGVRVLPAANFETYKAESESLRDAYDNAVRDFCLAWPTIIEEARVRLNGMFNASDYPADVRKKFGSYVRYLPVPDADDFRVSIAEGERDKLRDQIESTMKEAQDTAMRDLWERVAGCVAHMAQRLSAYTLDPVTGKASNIFRDTLVTNLRDVNALLPRLNFANDPKLEALRTRIETELLQFDADTLRERDDKRADVAKKAADIARDLSEFMK